jgi:hypothetical protein
MKNITMARKIFLSVVFALVVTGTATGHAGVVLDGTLGAERTSYALTTGSRRTWQDGRAEPVSQLQFLFAGPFRSPQYFLASPAFSM